MKHPNRKAARVNPDFRVTGDLTSTLIEKLNLVLSEDTSFRAQYLKAEWLSKYCETDKASAALRRNNAIVKWRGVEDLNAATNARLKRWVESSVEVLPGVPASRFFAKMRDMVSSVLVCDPSLDLLEGGFSSGASTSKRRLASSPARKFQDKADVSRKAWTIFRDLARGTGWLGHIDAGCEPRIVDHNILFTVPKTSEIDRVAAKEPDLNMYLQKMLGNQIRHLLKRKGVDLNDQRRNQRFALSGSITGDLATLDLSSASDSVTTEFVRAVMPVNWHYYLDAFRSHATLIDDELHVNNMFSSMGNGFTFELESLLFYSLARTVAYFTGVRGHITVYGDDIIAPTMMFDALVAALTFCGFKVNPKKSFAEGPFRESCGAHWYAGVDVKPFYLRGPLKRLSDVIHIANALTAWASVDGIVDPRYDEVIRFLRERVPTDYWGGRDFESRGALVTADKPRKELIWQFDKLGLFALYGSVLARLASSEPRMGSYAPLRTRAALVYWARNLTASADIEEIVGQPKVVVRSAYCRAGKLQGKTVYRLRADKQDIAYLLSDYAVPEAHHD